MNGRVHQPGARYTSKFITNGTYSDTSGITPVQVDPSFFNNTAEAVEEGLIEAGPEIGEALGTGIDPNYDPERAGGADDLLNYIFRNTGRYNELPQWQRDELRLFYESLYGEWDYTGELTHLKEMFPDLYDEEGRMTVEALDWVASQLNELMQDYEFIREYRQYIDLPEDTSAGVVPAGTNIGAYVGVNNGVVYAGGGGAPSVSGEQDDENAQEDQRLMRQLIGIVERMANKEWKVDFTPNSKSGAAFSKSIDMYNRAKG